MYVHLIFNCVFFPDRFQVEELELLLFNLNNVHALLVRFLHYMYNR